MQTQTLDLKKMNLIAIPNSELVEINGGMSDRSLAIGVALSVASPVIGAVYFLSYYANSGCK